MAEVAHIMASSFVLHTPEMSDLAALATSATPVTDKPVGCCGKVVSGTRTHTGNDALDHGCGLCEEAAHAHAHKGHE